MVHPDPSAPPRPALKILLTAPRGFCAGVDRAIKIVEMALQKFGAPVYVRHEIVHNRHVVERLKALGAIFVEELDECQADRPVVFSAHGVPKSVPAEARTSIVQFLNIIEEDGRRPRHRSVDQAPAPFLAAAAVGEPRRLAWLSIGHALSGSAAELRGQRGRQSSNKVVPGCRCRCPGACRIDPKRRAR